MNFRYVILALLACLILVPIAAFAQNKSNGKGKNHKTEAIENEILRLEKVGRQKALNGETNWDDLMSEGAYLIQGDGTTMTYQKGQNLSSMPLKSFKLSELIVRVYRDSAVATGLSEISSETPDKKPFSFQMRYLNVWKRFGNFWKIVVAERTMVRPYTK